jgi:Cell division septal protein
MHQQISKKIIIYLFIFLILGTFNNKKISKLYLNDNFDFSIVDQSEFNEDNIIKDLSKLKNQNLFLLKKNDVLATIDSHKIVENFFVFKNYPSSLNIKIERTKFLAITKKNGSNFYIGSNGNLIQMDNKKYDLPFIFGDIEISEFIELKRIVDNSKFDFNDIKNLFYFKSKRWDIETKNGILIKLPRENLNKSFELLLNIINKKKMENINNIDLRQNNQVILNG